MRFTHSFKPSIPRIRLDKNGGGGTSGHIDSIMYKRIWERYFSTP